MIKQLFLVTAIATATGCGSIDMADYTVPLDTIVQADNCWDVVDKLNEPRKLFYPELEGEVAATVLDKGWLTAEQIANVQSAGRSFVKIGMTGCEVIWTMRQVPDKIDIYESQHGRIVWYRYEGVDGSYYKNVSLENNSVTFIGS